MNFKIGSSKAEVNEYIKRLVKAKILNQDNRGKLTYSYKLNDRLLPTVDFEFELDFYKDQLCRIKGQASAPWNNKEVDGNYMTQKFRSILLSKYPNNNAIDLPTEGISGLAIVRGKELIKLENNEESGISLSQSFPAILDLFLEEDTVLNPPAISNDKFLEEIKQNPLVQGATITDVNFLYIAVINDNRRKDEMAEYYCRLSRLKGILISAVKIVDASTYREEAGAAFGTEIGKSFCN